VPTQAHKTNFSLHEEHPISNLYVLNLATVSLKMQLIRCLAGPKWQIIS